jgi:protease I
MKKIYLILLALLTIYNLPLTTYAQEVSAMKKAVMIIAEDNFRDEELFEPREILENNGIEVKVASTSLGQASGMLGATVKPDILVRDIKVSDFDAIVFVGGSGSSQYWDDPLAHKLAKEAVDNNKIVAAICIAPVTLANAGILKGKRATVWSSQAGQLRAKGANYTGKSVEKEGKIITATGPSAAREFGEALVNALKEE